MRILRYPSISEAQFFGCTAAFVDSLVGELNAATAALRRLEGQRKGSAFAYEMTFDRHRYGAIIVIDRWSSLVAAFGPHLELTRHPAIVQEAAARTASAENILSAAHRMVDAANQWSSEVVEACALAYQTVSTTFAEEREEADHSAKLGPMLPEDYTSARRIFLEDLAAR